MPAPRTQRAPRAAPSQQSETWHPVTPQITDPDLAPPAQEPGRVAELEAPPAPSRSFFQEHKFALIVSAIIVVIVIVVVYVYITRRGDKKKKAAEGGAPTGPPPGPSAEDVNLEELARLREERRAARAMGAAHGPPPAAATQGPYGPPPQGPPSQGPPQQSPPPQGPPQAPLSSPAPGPPRAPPQPPKGQPAAAREPGNQPREPADPAPRAGGLVPPVAATGGDEEMAALYDSLADEAAAAAPAE